MASDKNSLTGHLLSSNQLAQILDQGDFGQRAYRLAHQALPAINDLMGEINKQVYSLYAHEPTQEQLRDNWIRLLNSLGKIGGRIDIATTNYDFVIEHAIHFSKADIITGETGPVRRHLDLEKWASSVGGEFDVGLLTKLHGSLNWIRTEAGIEVGDPNFHNEHKLHAIVYPGFKGSIAEEPFRLMHSWFESKVRKADLLIVIGFAFRDEYLNQIIERSIGADSTIVVINPDERARLPNENANVLYIKQGLGIESIRTLMEFLSSAD